MRASLLFAVMLMASTGALAQKPLSPDITSPVDPESVRQELYDFVANQEQLLNTLEQAQATDPHLRRSISRQMQLVSDLSAQELSILAQSAMTFAETNRQLAASVAALETSLSSAMAESLAVEAKAAESQDVAAAMAAVQAAATAGAPHLEIGCPSDDQNVPIGGFGPIFSPPGYCQQTDMIPVVTTDGSGGLVFEDQEFRLSDVGYPLICPINIENTVVLVLETATMIVKTINDTTEKLCQQEAAGFNGSTACIVLVLGLRLSEDILDQSTECNSERRDSEGTTIYSRTGEIFVQSNAHYSALNAADELIRNAVDVLSTNIGGQVFNLGEEVADELSEGFADIEVRANALERRILDNSEKANFIRINDEVIEYKVWCDKQRPSLRPSNCQ